MIRTTLLIGVLTACSGEPPTDSADGCGDIEWCGDGIDNDCDGQVDEDDAGDSVKFYADADGDGFGAGAMSSACEVPNGHVTNDDDCDDASAAVHPDATEVCNDVDDDCDGAIDEDLATDVYYLDLDGDGYGDPDVSVSDCAAPEGHTSVAGDCDDEDGNVHPGADEVCDGVDNDCDGDVDSEVYGQHHDCPAVTCEDLHDAGLGLGSSTYWIKPASTIESFEVECDMVTDGGGWTQITGDLLQEQGWVEFSEETGLGDWDASWEASGEFRLEPQHDTWVDSGDQGCETLAVRATAEIPWIFDEWFGSFRATAHDTDSLADDNLDASLGYTWGESFAWGLDVDCPGVLRFGSDTEDVKVHGVWGQSWYASAGAQWVSWPQSDSGTTTRFRWEHNDDGNARKAATIIGDAVEDVYVTDIEIWVR